MITGKKNWVLAGLILALGAAVYLNWQFAPTENFLSPSDNVPPANAQEDSLGEAQFVGTTPEYNEDGEVVNAAAEASDTFAGTRASRQMARYEALDTLQDIIDDASLSGDEKAAAVQKIAEIADRMDREASIETLVKAKGYADCVVVISDNQVNVLVPAKEGGLTAADVAIIKDIVIGQVEIVPSSVKIIEAKPSK